MTTVETDLQS